MVVWEVVKVVWMVDGGVGGGEGGVDGCDGNGGVGWGGYCVRRKKVFTYVELYRGGWWC